MRRLNIQDEELDYIILDFEDSVIFKQHIQPLLVLLDLYKTEGIKDHGIQNYFNSFIIDQYLDKKLNNFAQWKKKNTNRSI